MKKKQTAVEWLADQLSINDRARYNGMIEQAEVMEKEQKKHAYAKCYTPFSFGRIGDLNQDFTKYYEETYENS